MKDNAGAAARTGAAVRSSTERVPSSRTERGGKRRSPRKKAGGKDKQPPLGIRQAQETRTLLEQHLHNLYWWVFNAHKIRGFVQAKRSNQRVGEDSEIRVDPRQFGGPADSGEM